MLGFLGTAAAADKPSPSSVDADVYQIRRVPGDNGVFTLLENFIVWDCPDMTTWAAAGYVPRLLEIAGLADVIVYVASDERYNDEVPTQFLQLLLQAGKAVVVCLVKMSEADAAALVAHFKKEVLGPARGRGTELPDDPATHAGPTCATRFTRRASTAYRYSIRSRSSAAHRPRRGGGRCCRRCSTCWPIRSNCWASPAMT